MYTDLKLQNPVLRWTGVNRIKRTKNAGKLEAPLLEVDPGAPFPECSKQISQSFTPWFQTKDVLRTKFKLLAGNA